MTDAADLRLTESDCEVHIGLVFRSGVFEFDSCLPNKQPEFRAVKCETFLDSCTILDILNVYFQYLCITAVVSPCVNTHQSYPLVSPGLSHLPSGLLSILLLSCVE